LTEEQLNELCLEWQKVLRLQDWDIHATIRRAKEMVNADADGECYWTLGLKEGFIHILDPIDHNPRAIGKPDIEATLVHELLHLHFAEWDDSTGQGMPISGEQAIECIAQALVRVKRQSQT